MLRKNPWRSGAGARRPTVGRASSIAAGRHDPVGCGPIALAPTTETSPSAIRVLERVAKGRKLFGFLREHDTRFARRRFETSRLLDVDHLPICGDAALEPGELCDDGGTSVGDGCTSGCALE
ncbi:MAG: hypothetical protein ACE37F_01550 [Nannocystaceae bacterium]|nr:hypothetical protein [bacterium]